MQVRRTMIMAVIVLLAPQAHAQATSSPQPQTISATCRTPSSTGDGAMFQCTSERAQIHAPEGFAFVQASLAGGIVESGGTKPACDVEWAEFVALAPDSETTQPRALTLRARAASQRGYGRRGPGWATCSYTVELVPYAAPSRQAPAARDSSSP